MFTKMIIDLIRSNKKKRDKVFIYSMLLLYAIPVDIFLIPMELIIFIIYKYINEVE